MKAKLCILCTLLCIVFNTSYAQIENFDISQYKLADYKRQSLDFNFNMLGQSDIRNDKTDFSTNKSNTDEFSSSIDLDYNYYLNTRKNQKHVGVYGSVNPYDYYYSNNSNSTYSKRESSSTNVNVSFQFSNSHYLNSNLFYKIGFYTQNYYGRFKISEKYNSYLSIPDYSNNMKHIITNNHILLGFGTGRIENVGDAQLAIFLLSDLLKNNSLTRSPSDEEILLFTEKITKLKNRRAFDYRLRKIFEIQAIDTFLRNSDLISKSDAVYFTTINDIWAYSNYYYRASGLRLSLNCMPMFYYMNIHNSLTNPETQDQKMFGIDIYGELMFAQPINFKWQQTTSLLIDFVRERNRYSDDSDKTMNDIKLSANYKLGFYPNSRTFAEGYVQGSITKRKYDEEYYDYHNLFGSVESGLLVSYYISERMNVLLNANIAYSQYNYPEDQYMQYQKNLRPYIKLDFNYVLF